MNSLGGTFITPTAGQWIVGIPLALIAFPTFLLAIVGGKNRWWWTGIALVPAVLFEVLFDPFHVYVPVLIGLIAWGLGYLANKALHKLAPRLMSKIS